MTSSKYLVKKQYEIFADYHQFYLMDSEVYPNAPTEYTDEDVQRKVKAEKNIVVIMPERNMTVPVELEVLKSAPTDNFEDWQHVAEASLELHSGKLLVMECGESSIDEILLPPNFYKVRAYFGDLDKLSFDELEGDDHYKIVIWQAPFADIKVLKQYRVGRGFE